MLYMNEIEIEDALSRYRDHPILRPATETLLQLMDWTNAHSDGWAYWPKPCRAARNLQELIGSLRTYLDNPERAEVSLEDLRLAYRPLKSFRTRYQATFEIVQP